MGAYLVRRLFGAVGVLFGISIITFVIVLSAERLSAVLREKLA